MPRSAWSGKRGRSMSTCGRAWNSGVVPRRRPRRSRPARSIRSGPAREKPSRPVGSPPTTFLPVGAVACGRIVAPRAELATSSTRRPNAATSEGAQRCRSRNWSRLWADARERDDRPAWSARFGPGGCGVGWNSRFRADRFEVAEEGGVAGSRPARGRLFCLSLKHPGRY